MPKKKGRDDRPLTDDESIKLFIKMLESGSRSFGVYERFRHFCEMAYCACAKTTATSQEKADALEERYMKIVETYPNKADVNIYGEMMGLACMRVMEGGIDFLGTVASQLELLDARQGQFFTPYPVCRMMAKMLLQGQVAQDIERDGYFTLNEPAAGAGAIVLAAADELQEMGYNPVVNMLVTAMDISQIAYYMCYLQLTWRGVAAQVFRGNTLSMEVFESAWTPAIYLFNQYQEERKQEQRVMKMAQFLRDLVREEPKPKQSPLPPELAALRWAAINRRWCVSQAQVIKA